MKATLSLLLWTLVLIALSITVRCQSVPDSPTQEVPILQCGIYSDIDLQWHKITCHPTSYTTIWRAVPPPVPKKVTYWTFRRSWQDPPLRTNRQQLKSRAYLISTALGDTAVIVSCFRKHSGEHPSTEIPAALGVDFMAFLDGKYFTQSFAVGPQFYKLAHYIHSSIK